MGHWNIVVLRRHRLWVVVGAIWLNVCIVHLRRVLLLLLMRMLIVRPPPIPIRRHALPCRQMTTVHHAGLGDSASKPTRVLDRVGDAFAAARCRMNCSRRGLVVRLKTVSASKRKCRGCLRVMVDKQKVRGGQVNRVACALEVVVSMRPKL